MRFTIKKQGKIAAMGQQRETAQDALALAMHHRGEARPGETVTIEDNLTGRTYKNEEIDEFRRALDNEQ